MQRAEGFGQSPPYVIQGGPGEGDKGPGDRDDGLQGHRTSKQHYRGRESRRPPSALMKYWHDFKHRGRFFTVEHLNEMTDNLKSIFNFENMVNKQLFSKSELTWGNFTIEHKYEDLIAL